MYKRQNYYSSDLDAIHLNQPGEGMFNEITDPDRKRRAIWAMRRTHELVKQEGCRLPEEKKDYAVQSQDYNPIDYEVKLSKTMLDQTAIQVLGAENMHWRRPIEVTVRPRTLVSNRQARFEVVPEPHPFAVRPPEHVHEPHQS